MNELANLVFQASAAKQKILEDKLERTKKAVESDRDAVSRELSNVLRAELLTRTRKIEFRKRRIGFRASMKNGWDH